MLTLYGIANCDSIKKTRLWLEDHDIPYQFHDYRKQGIDAALARRMIAAVPLEILINKRGTTWKKLTTEQQTDLNPERALTLMLEQPALIKRPLLHGDAGWLAGYDEDKLRCLTSNETK